MKLVFVTGGVVSSLGKGVTAASLGRLLKARGYSVSMQKCDTYYNLEPALISPIQNGEAFITEDGSATDLDLGHYERFIDENLLGEASITTGKVHRSLMERELRGEYRGSTIQVVPHVTDEIKRRILTSAEKSGADIAIIEIGGVVGDMESSPYLEAIRQLRLELGAHNTCFVHVTLIPYISVAGEMKTKPTQHSVKDLRSIGIQPDVIVCRTEKMLSNEAKDKIALFCNVKTGHVINNMDVDTPYEAPLCLEKEHFASIVLKELAAEDRTPDLTAWKDLVDRIYHPVQTVRIALVGKYVSVPSAYLSVREALLHAGFSARATVQIDWIDSTKLESGDPAQYLKDHDGIIIPGGYGQHGAEGIMRTCTYARENKLPCLMICYGMQLAAVEAVRSLLHQPHANSTEVVESCDPQVVRLNPKEIEWTNHPGHMGAKTVRLQAGRLQSIYSCDEISERHANRYEINADLLPALEKKGLHFTASRFPGGEADGFELEGHPFYIGVMFHPEFKSRPNRPHPLFEAFLQAAMA